MLGAKRRIEIDESFTTPEPEELEQALKEKKVDLVRNYGKSRYKRPRGALVDLILKGAIR